MITRECACHSGERCDSIDDDGTYCEAMREVDAYWRSAWNNATPAERASVTEYNAAMIDAGRGHLVGT